MGRIKDGLLYGKTKPSLQDFNFIFIKTDLHFNLSPYESRGENTKKSVENVLPVLIQILHRHHYLGDCSVPPVCF